MIFSVFCTLLLLGFSWSFIKVMKAQTVSEADLWKINLVAFSVLISFTVIIVGFGILFSSIWELISYIWIFTKGFV